MQQSRPRTLPTAVIRAVFTSLALAALALFPAQAQEASEPASPQGQAPAPTVGALGLEDSAPERADAAVREWLRTPTRSILPSTALTAAEICQQLPGMINAAASPEGTVVRLE